MINILKCIFYVSGFIIFIAMIGYPFSLKLIGRLYRSKENKKDYSHLPTVTVDVLSIPVQQ